MRLLGEGELYAAAREAAKQLSLSIKTSGVQRRVQQVVEGMGLTVESEAKLPPPVDLTVDLVVKQGVSYPWRSGLSCVGLCSLSSVLLLTFIGRCVVAVFNRFSSKCASQHE